MIHSVTLPRGTTDPASSPLTPTTHYSPQITEYLRVTAAQSELAEAAGTTARPRSLAWFVSMIFNECILFER